MSTIQQCEMFWLANRWHNDDVTFPCHLHSKQQQATVTNPITMLRLTSQCQPQLTWSHFCANLLINNSNGTPLLPSCRQSCRTSDIDSVGANATTLHHIIFEVHVHHLFDEKTASQFNKQLSQFLKEKTSNAPNSRKRETLLRSWQRNIARLSVEIV